MARDVIAVPAKGVERWLMQRLSHLLGVGANGSDGVCANVEFPSPSWLVAHTLADVTGTTADDDPWRSEALMWALLDVIDRCVGEPWCTTLSRHLGACAETNQHRRRRRLATAAHLARLVDTYAANRPAMIRDWYRGDDTDGAGSRLPDDLTWQAELWRRLRSDIGTPSPAERQPAALDRLRESPQSVDLPPRLSVFGATRLTAAQLDVLHALADGRDVHLWIPHPSPALWHSLAAIDTDATPIRRRSDPSLDRPRNPLLASLGRDVRELQLRLTRVAHTDVLHDVESSATTLLHRLQHTVATDEPTTASPAQLVHDVGDESFRVHACHGRARQVEVLREVLVGLLEADDTLEPRDVIVMCPDVETYAPLISATFGLDDDDADRHPGHKLRVRLADRSLRQTNSLLAALATVLDLAGRRITASEVLDLAASPPVRRRFRFDDDDLDRLRDWVANANIRWGIDAEHRRPWALDRLPQNTWRAGLDRILLGVAMSEDDLRYVGTCLPLDDVDSSDIDLAGRFTELVERVARAVDAMAGDHPLDHWIAVLGRTLDELTATSDADAWQRSQVDGELATIATAGRDRIAAGTLGITDIATLLADEFAGRPTRANFRTGSLTVCSMVPMRSVPHRIVCLLGLDDGAFPRTTAVDGDDVLARDPCIGERDRRSEDRQLLLDAVMAACETLVVVYSGADPRTNARRPPAVPVGELLDAVRRIATTGDPSEDILDRVTTRHPLQPFDARNFTTGALVPGRPFSFDRHSLFAAEEAGHERVPPGPLAPTPLAVPASDDIALTQLVAFLEHPVKAFLRQRLDVSVLGDEPEIADALTVTLDGLQQWAVGDHLLAARLRGATAATAGDAEWRRGNLPPGTFGRHALLVVEPRVESLVIASAPWREGDARQVDVDAGVGGRRVTGTVSGVRGDCIVRVEYSRLAPKHRLRAWAQLVALTVTHPERSWIAVTIGRGTGDDAAGSTLGPVDPTDAGRHLAELIDLRDRGLRQPLPLVVKTSHDYAEKRRDGKDPATAATIAFERNWYDDKRFGSQEMRELPHRLAWNGAVDHTILIDVPGPAGELGSDWPADEPHWFGRLARRLWDPLVAHERRGL
jgi:exodeoxyribonuclease V gamma subunit